MVAFSIFWWNIYRYGIFYLIGFLITYFLFFTLGKKQVFRNFKNIQNLLTIDLDSFFIVLILWVLIWWRLWHVFIYDFQSFVWNWLDVFKVWQWWMSFIWWITWVIIWISIFAWKKKFTLKEFWILLDLCAVIAPLCIALWRLGNFLNQELYWIEFMNRLWLSGNIIEILTSLWFLHVYPKVDDLLRINTNFLSILFEWLMLFICLVIIFIKQFKSKKWSIWKISKIFLLWYSIVRFLLEYLRNDSQSEFIWYFSKSQWVFLWFILIGIIWIVCSSKINKKEYL